MPLLDGISIRATLSDLERIAAIPEVSRILLDEPLGLRVGLDFSRRVIHADAVQNPPVGQAYFGSGVRVAVLDTGIGLETDGVYHPHPDLPGNIYVPDRGPNVPSAEYPNPHGFVDYVPGNPPKPAEPGYDDKYRGTFGSHGTRVAGIIVS